MRIRSLTWMLLLALAAGTISFFAVRLVSLRESNAADSTAWLRAEFKLSEEQTLRIAALHRAYEPVCEEHCRAVREAHGKLTALRASAADETALREADGALEALREFCRVSTESHVRSVAAIMDPGLGARYLELVLPRLAQAEHTGAPDLQANSPAPHHGQSTR